MITRVSGDNYMSPGVLAQLWVEEETKRKELEKKLRETLQSSQVWSMCMSHFVLSLPCFCAVGSSQKEHPACINTVSAVSVCFPRKVQFLGSTP